MERLTDLGENGHSIDSTSAYLKEYSPPRLRPHERLLNELLGHSFFPPLSNYLIRHSEFMPNAYDQEVW